MLIFKTDFFANSTCIQFHKANQHLHKMAFCCLWSVGGSFNFHKREIELKLLVTWPDTTKGGYCTPLQSSVVNNVSCETDRSIVLRNHSLRPPRHGSLEKKEWKVKDITLKKVHKNGLC